MKFEELQKEAESDLSFDILSAERASLQAPKLKEKYARYLFQAKAGMKKAEIDKAVQWKKLHRYYTEDFPKRLNKPDVPEYIKGDDKYVKVCAAYESHKLKVEYIESILKAIDQLSFNLGNAIKLHIFMNGG